MAEERGGPTTDEGDPGAEPRSEPQPGTGAEESARRVDHGSATGAPGTSGTEATDFRVQEER